MKKKNFIRWQVISNNTPILSAPRGKLILVVNNDKSIPLTKSGSEISDSISLWTHTPIKTILKEIKMANHPAALNAIQKLTINHENRLEIMMSLYEARSKIYKQGA